jgi:spermidine synthase
MKRKNMQSRGASPGVARDEARELAAPGTKGAPVRPLSPWTRVGAKLFLLGFSTLFLELFFIRYLAGSIWNLGYFPNLVLLSAFIGMGTGFVFHHHLDVGWSKVLFQGAFAASVALIAFVSLKHPIVPGFDVWHYNLDGDLYFAFVPFQVDNDLNYLFFILCFVVVALIFACLSQRTAKLFRQFAPLSAYTLDILGSCAGVLTFMAVSALRLPAWTWFGIFTVIFLLAMPAGWKARLLPVALSAIAILVMFRQDRVFMRDPKSTNPLQTFWSPYQKVEYVEEPPPPGVPGDLRRRIFVNGLDHQEMHVKLDKLFYQIPYFYREQKGLPRYKNVLVIGAGSGNDVAVALEHGAEHVDAVEIDPVIAMLGREHSPSKAYVDPRVNVVVDDGRAFMTQAKRKYDLIVFALTDSLVKVSSLTQLRLENYLFTRESVERACELLEEGGHIVFYNFYRLPFVAEKIQDLVGHATGRAPVVLCQDRDFYMVCGEKLTSPVRGLRADLAGPARPTDDWPFLYLENRGIPKLYLKAMGGVFCLITALLVALHLSTRRKEGFHAPGLLPIKIAFVVMGIAFLLLEAKSVIQFSLLFGATWFNNSLIFLAVLISVLAANWTVQWLNSQKWVRLFYVLLLAAALSSFFIPLHALLHIQGTLPRFIAGALLTLSPIYFGNLIFSSMFKDQKIPEHIFGWNLLGATLGGILEYVSMSTGYNALSLIVATLYTLVFALLLLAKRRRGETGPPTPSRAQRARTSS